MRMSVGRTESVQRLWLVRALALDAQDGNASLLPFLKRHSGDKAKLADPRKSSPLKPPLDCPSSRQGLLLASKAVETHFSPWQCRSRLAWSARAVIMAASILAPLPPLHTPPTRSYDQDDLLALRELEGTGFEPHGEDFTDDLEDLVS